ncbi:MAG: hypothetical protein MJ175_04905 [Clostridia bacterium]|nr:hypothetical protein [Clostridia bacterium]
MKRSLSLCFALLLLAGSMASCGEAAETPTQPQNTAAVTAPAETEPAETEEVVNLTVSDMGGKDFYIMSKMEGDVNGRWTAIDFAITEESGDVIDDAIYARDLKLEELFNCHIVNEFYERSTMAQTISKLVQAGDNTYSLFLPNIQESAKLARDGMLYDITDFDCVDLTAPWWNKSFTEANTFGGSVYYANGDISETFMRAAYAIFFSKQVIASYDLENPYDIVNSGKWTVDKMMEMSLNASEDINGNGIMDSADKIGLMVLFNSTEGFYAASGVKMVNVEADGTLVWNGDSERSIAVMNKIFDIYNTRTSTLNCTDATLMDAELKSVDNVVRGERLFASGNALFLFGTMNNVKAMRSMETDFGILPLPKVFDNQTSYESYVHTGAASCVCLPIMLEKPEESAAFMEAAAYYARKLITPAYYDTMLKTKVARDEESSAMLDIIYENRGSDLGNIFAVGDVLNQMTTMISTNYKNDFASMLAKRAATVQKNLDTINEAFKSSN